MRPFSMMSLVLTLVSCTSPQAEQPAAASEKASSTVTISKDSDQPPAPPVVRDDSEQLVFSWFDPVRGHTTGTRVADVPKGCRQDVVVADLSRTPEERQSSRYVMIANLDERRPDGSYSVVVQSRYRFADSDLSDLGPIAENKGAVSYTHLTLPTICSV